MPIATMRLRKGTSGGGGGSDPHWSLVKSLCHLDSFVGSGFTGTPIDEVSGTSWSGAIDWTNNPTKFGAGARRGGFSNVSNPGMASGTGDATWECWVYATALGNQGVFGTGSLFGSHSNIGLGYFSGTGKWQISYGAGGAAEVGTPIVTGRWYHVALVRISSVLYLYVDGILQGSVPTTFNNTANSISFGIYYSSGYPWDGYIDEFRYTEGLGRYTSNFTPPSGPFPNS